ncbi:hypothetical protein CGZ98_21140 [Enemella evansiae]|uniref:putative RNA methyltransferase n=1 Tax=Enemella evansiae TaxID=2016499 RepID=UPI000B976072|nr:hypothetical protein [Enemella evansiae]OYO07024.1 hypothetical protein CGZ98_21140 [Enemella evansiae]
MLAEVTDLLRCPLCREQVRVTERVLECTGGHRFDLARQGYVNLLGHAAPAHADTAEMVAARADFLAGGPFRPLVELLADAAVGSRVVEAGAGTGYYLAGVLAALGSDARGVAADLSAYACRRAARVPRAGAIVADTWAGLPVADGVADTLLCVFAPRNPTDFARMLAPEGRLLVLTPTERHLAELRTELGLLEVEAGKQERLLRSMTPELALLDTRPLEFEVTLAAEDLRRLVLMGPNAFHHSDPAVPDRATVTVSVRLSIFGHTPTPTE